MIVTQKLRKIYLTIVANEIKSTDHLTQSFWNKIADIVSVSKNVWRNSLKLIINSKLNLILV